MMHDSGTGGAASLGNFPLFPYKACNGSDINGCNYSKTQRVLYGSFKNETIVAKPGFFGVTLDTGIKTEMTTSHHTALFKFTFPSDSDKPLILQDLSDLSDSRLDNSTIKIDPNTGRITGSGHFYPSYGVDSYTLYFCTDFKGGKMIENGIFVDSRASSSVKNLTISQGITSFPTPGGVFARFADASEPIIARVATSFKSCEQACTSAEAEIPDFDLNRVADEATQAWRTKLSPIQVSAGGANKSFLTNFYSSMYRTMISPQNYTGENPLWSSNEPYFDSFYCLWDLWRTSMPLLTVLDPHAFAEMIRSLIDIYKNVGWLPDWCVTGILVWSYE